MSYVLKKLLSPATEKVLKPVKTATRINGDIWNADLYLAQAHCHLCISNSWWLQHPGSDAKSDCKLCETQKIHSSVEVYSKLAAVWSWGLNIHLQLWCTWSVLVSLINKTNLICCPKTVTPSPNQSTVSRNDLEIGFESPHLNRTKTFMWICPAYPTCQH